MSTGLCKESTSVTPTASRSLSPLARILVSLLLGIGAFGITQTQRASLAGPTSAETSREARSLSERGNQEIASWRYKESESALAAGLTGTLPLFSIPTEHVSDAGSSASTESSSGTDPQAGGAPVTINFDDVAAFTEVGARYPHVVFSSPGLSVYTFFSQNGDFPRSRPNSVTRGVMTFFGVQNKHSADFIADFPTPVDDLKFYVTSCDDFFSIALLDYYQNGILKQANIAIGGCDPSHPPLLVDFKTPGIKGVSRIRIHNITDSLGLSFDDFSFTVPNANPTPAPTPTPAPSPTPPPVPTDLRATPDEEAITLNWSPSIGAIGYFVKRLGDSGTLQNTKIESAVTIANAFITIGTITNTTTFTDDGGGHGLSSDVTYSYVVSAFGAGGESLESQRVSGKPLPQPACTASPTPAPASGSVGNFGWTMNYGFSDRDGLVVSEVHLNGKRMAKQMSVPYFWITTSSTANPNLVRTRGELTPAGTGSSMRSRLVNYKINPTDPDKILIEANYAIDQIPGAPKACLNISQKYEFYRAGSSPPDLVGPCEPSDTVVPCNKFRPMIEYSFHGGSGESLSSLNTPIRLHFQNTETSGNTVALTRDFDEFRDVRNHPVVPFRTVLNPLENAWWSKVIVQRSPQNPDKNANTVDNFHQTDDKISVILPGLKIWQPTTLLPPIPVFQRAGCPECVHFHWRWSKFLGSNFHNGLPIVPPGSDQAVDIQVVPFKNVFENFHPTDYYQLFHPKEPLRNPAKGVKEPYDVVLWYSPTGFANDDKFFWHTAWFTPKRLTASNTVAFEHSNDSLNASSVQDGPVSVDFGSVYEIGNATFSAYDPSTVAPLPAGYAALNNAGYLIDTTGVVSGPHVINFSAASVTDETVFNNLRIFYAEPDPFDPEKPVWVDATILSPDTPSPNFSAKTLSARSGRLGVFVIGTLVGGISSPGVANLRLSTTDSSDPITAGNNLTYTVTVANDGPQTATEVMLKDSLSPDVTFVSATTSQGTCKSLNGVVYCNLNSLTSGTSATVTIVVQPTEGTDSFPMEGKMIANTVFVRAREDDGDPSNDYVTEETNVLPNPNKPPIVNITTPITGAFFVGPANIALSAVATDTDGSIARVDFFDNGELIGSGVAGTGNTYTLTKTIGACGPPPMSLNAGDTQPNHQTASPCGSHSFVAVATDNAGRQNVSSPVDVMVNGTATINVTSPASGSLASPGSNITLTASATDPSGVLSKVEFFANELPLGQGTSVGASQYSLTWPNVAAGMYSIIAVATDGSQVRTWSVPIAVTVGTPPTVTISSPAENAVFPSLTNISVSAMAQSTAGSIVKVDFYANGVLIGTARDVGTDSFMVTWRQLADGFYTLTAVASDALGLTSTSAGVHIAVNNVPESGQLVWFDDALPQGAVKHGDTDIDWYWVDANPGPFSGTKSHQSRNFAQLEGSNGFHQHYFEGATQSLPVNVGDKLFTYVFLDINNMPREIMLQWHDGNNWEHRARWGANNINFRR